MSEEYEPGDYQQVYDQPPNDDPEGDDEDEGPTSGEEDGPE